MHLVGIIIALGMIALVLVEGFETILSPRRVMHRFRYARFYYLGTWRLWRLICCRIPAGKKRQTMLSIFGPASLLGLFATWVIGLIFGFALFLYCSKSQIHGGNTAPTLLTYLYLSGTTFFTLGYGDLTPAHGLGKALSVFEAGLGFAFLAVLISYLPVLYQAFSTREVTISLLDARAGSPPSACEILLRLGRSRKIDGTESILRDWEIWAAELLESHLSFPVLSYYRSQHDNQSWLAALATILDTTALLLVVVRQEDTYQAQLTFAMARHAAVDLGLVLRSNPGRAGERLSSERFAKMREKFHEAGVALRGDPDMEARLTKLRGTYEPFLVGLSERLMFTVPAIFVETPTADNWQRSAWMELPPGIGNLSSPMGDEEHF
jgi:hypothetical protein